MLAGEGVTLRELRLEDAPTLLAMLTTEEVSRFISPPPTTVEGFEQFIVWAREQREADTMCASGRPRRHDHRRRAVPGAVETIGAFRLEARSAVQNGRGNGALRKLGAEREGVLKKAFLLRGTYYDQNIWSILASAWAQAKVTWEPRAA